ncbi:MAG: alpha/beta hydrolase-fold protein, partial [Polyangiaceae bacterium]
LTLFLCLGCSDPSTEPANTGGAGGSGGVGGSGGQSGGAGGSGGGAGQSGGGGQSGTSPDASLFADVLAGKVDAAEGLTTIAQRGGLPIATPEGYVFAHLDDGKGPYILEGDFNGWAAQSMQLESGVYWASVVIGTPDGSKYKFVDGGSVHLADPLARRYGWDQFGEYSLVAASAPHRERFPQLGGEGRPPRTVRVWISSAAPSHHLYVHDGQNLFDPDAINGGWKLDETAGAKTLVIGIDNIGAGRMDEYTPFPDDIGSGPVGGQGDAYADYVEKVVRPAVESRYGVPQRVGVMGSSLGGLIALHQMQRHPGRYDFVASLSGTLGWGSIGPHTQTLIERFAANAKPGEKVYLDSGGGAGSGCVDSDADGVMDDAPNSSDNYCETVQLRDVLAGKGMSFDVELWHWHEPGAPHNEVAWAGRVFRPLGIFEAL